MTTKKGVFICEICGKFVPYNYFYSWTEYGSSYSTEPPDPCYAHVHCYENLHNARKQRMITISWIKPHLYDYRREDNEDENNKF